MAPAEPPPLTAAQRADLARAHARRRSLGGRLMWAVMDRKPRAKKEPRP